MQPFNQRKLHSMDNKFNKKVTKNPNTLSIDPHILQKFHLKNLHITKPLDSIQNKLYSFITSKHPNLAIIQHKFPYLSKKMTLEGLKCLQPLSNFTHLNSIQNHPPINPENIIHTNPATNMLSWNYIACIQYCITKATITNKQIHTSIHNSHIRY